MRNAVGLQVQSTRVYDIDFIVQGLYLARSAREEKADNVHNFDEPHSFNKE
jgi:hypothetical protein